MNYSLELILLLPEPLINRLTQSGGPSGANTIYQPNLVRPMKESDRVISKVRNTQQLGEFGIHVDEADNRSMLHQQCAH
jgi:hypothetical protein